MAAHGQKVLVVWENTDKNTDQMAVQSGEREGDGVKVVEKLGCGGSVTAFFNPENIEDCVALRAAPTGFKRGLAHTVW